MVKKYVVSGIISGLLVSLGGCVFLACENRYVGAFFFSVALLSICILGFSLFTGKVGYIVEVHKKENWSELLLCLLGNTIGAAVSGFAMMLTKPAMQEKAFEICTSKLALPLSSALIFGIYCGILMFLAVALYREGKTVIGVLFCIPVFILSGFEHSIADMFYFAAAGIVSFEAFVFLFVIIIGNSIGGMLIPTLRLLMRGKSNG